MRGSDATQPKEPAQRLWCFATMIVVFQVGLGDFEIVLRCDLHSRETVPPSVHEAGRVKQTIRRPRVNQKSL